MFIFPGLGLGVVASRATNVSDYLFYVAARRLADCVTEADLDQGKVRARRFSVYTKGHVRAACFGVSKTAVFRPPPPLLRSSLRFTISGKCRKRLQ